MRGDRPRAGRSRAATAADSADERLRATRSLRGQLALALLGDPKDHAGLAEALRGLGPGVPSLVVALNKGAHGGYDGSAIAMHERTRDLVAAFMRSA